LPLATEFTDDELRSALEFEKDIERRDVEAAMWAIAVAVKIPVRYLLAASSEGTNELHPVAIPTHIP